jgi:hypothetical protein
MTRANSGRTGSYPPGSAEHKAFGVSRPTMVADIAINLSCSTGFQEEHVGVGLRQDLRHHSGAASGAYIDNVLEAQR